MSRYYILALLIVPLLVLSACDSAIDGMQHGEAIESRPLETQTALISVEGESVDLIAGQHYQAGLVGVTRDGDMLTVTFRTYPGWCLLKTHVHVAASLDGIPRNRPGNPQIGHFMRQETLDCVNEASYDFDLAALGLSGAAEVVVAAHAEVRGTASECAVIFGIENETGDIYGLNPVSNYAEFLYAAGPNGNADWPNALGIDVEARRMYYSYENRDVFFLDLLTLDSHFAGTLTHGRAAGATFIDGDMYYMPHNLADDLIRVEFAPDGSIAAQVVVQANVAPGVSRFIFGDMVSRGDWIYFSARANNDSNPAVFARINKDGSGYSVISHTEPLMQLAFNKDKTVLYGHVTQQHADMREFFVIDLATGTRGPSLGMIEGRQFNDLTEGLGDCHDGDETAWGAGMRFVTQGNWATYFRVTL